MADTPTWPTDEDVEKALDAYWPDVEHDTPEDAMRAALSAVNPYEGLTDALLNGTIALTSTGNFDPDACSARFAVEFIGVNAADHANQLLDAVDAILVTSPQEGK